MENSTNNEASSVIVSNDATSKKIKIDKNTKLEDFYQRIINVIPPSDNNYNMNLFYYEAYSHEKCFVSNEKEYVTANKKGIEYFYFCSNSSNDNDNGEIIDYLKYYSVIIFSPIKILNKEFQNT